MELTPDHGRVFTECAQVPDFDSNSALHEYGALPGTGYIYYPPSRISASVCAPPHTGARPTSFVSPGFSDDSPNVRAYTLRPAGVPVLPFTPISSSCTPTTTASTYVPIGGTYASTGGTYASTGGTYASIETTCAPTTTNTNTLIDDTYAPIGDTYAPTGSVCASNDGTYTQMDDTYTLTAGACASNDGTIDDTYTLTAGASNDGTYTLTCGACASGGGTYTLIDDAYTLTACASNDGTCASNDETCASTSSTYTPTGTVSTPAASNESSGHRQSDDVRSGRRCRRSSIDTASLPSPALPAAPQPYDSIPVATPAPCGSSRKRKASEMCGEDDDDEGRIAATRRMCMEAEQCRRDELREAYSRLEDVLPPSKHKISKVSIVDRATTHIRYLQLAYQQLQTKMQAAEAETTRLRTNTQAATDPAAAVATAPAAAVAAAPAAATTSAAAAAATAPTAATASAAAATATAATATATAATSATSSGAVVSAFATPAASAAAPAGAPTLLLPPCPQSLSLAMTRLLLLSTVNLEFAQLQSLVSALLSSCTNHHHDVPYMLNRVSR
ncbi:hypothetical protein FOMPIDRAFT_1017792, partial [Fomitopsis schrenkii]